MNTQLMKNLIKTIEAAPGKSNREKLEACIQRLLCAMSAMANTQGGLSIRMDAPALGFKPIPIGSAKRWERELTTAYTDAVMKSEPFTDILGDVHGLMLYDSKAEGLGQHFTPKDLAQLTAAMGESHHKRHGTTDDRVYDPTCGAGGLILAVLALRDEAHLSKTTVVAQDIDPLCCAMTALQIVVNELVWGRAPGELRIECKDILADVELRTVYHAVRELNLAQQATLAILQAGRMAA